MQRVTRWIVRIFAAIPILGFLIWLTLSPGDPDLYPSTEDPRPVWVIDHGWHSGIIIGQAELRSAALGLELTDPEAAEKLLWLTSRFPAAEWLEIGWGDAEFYQQTPTVEDIDPWLAVQALFVPTDSAIQVVPGWGPPDQSFWTAKQRLPLSLDGFRKLALKLSEAIKPVPYPLGDSLYGKGHFYPSPLAYHLFRTCNHWVSNLVNAAGVPSSFVPGTFSITLMMELRARATAQ